MTKPATEERVARMRATRFKKSLTARFFDGDTMIQSLCPHKVAMELITAQLLRLPNHHFHISHKYIGAVMALMIHGKARLLLTTPTHSIIVAIGEVTE